MTVLNNERTYSLQRSLRIGILQEFHVRMASDFSLVKSIAALIPLSQISQILGTNICMCARMIFPTLCCRSTFVAPSHLFSAFVRDLAAAVSTETDVSDVGKTFTCKFIGYSEMNSTARLSLNIHGFCLWCAFTQASYLMKNSCKPNYLDFIRDIYSINSIYFMIKK